MGDVLRCKRAHGTQRDSVDVRDTMHRDAPARDREVFCMPTRLRCRIACVAIAAAIGMAPALPSVATQPPADFGGSSSKSDIRGSRAALRDAWLAADAALFGTYRGVDSTLGSRYHIFEAEDVWMGTPPRGRVVFKAPRGIRLLPGQTGLLLLWDRLAGATDAYLAEVQERFQDAFWAEVGPDSISRYLLPFAAYGYAFQGDKLRLRGSGTFATEVSRSRLKRDMLNIEIGLLPESLYRTSEAVLRAHVRAVKLQPRYEGGAVIDLRVAADLAVEEIYKGAPLDSLRLEFGSYPRAPRFRQDETVILFLETGPSGLYLAQGKRAVFHLVDGEVVEAGQPLAAFVATMRGK